MRTALVGLLAVACGVGLDKGDYWADADDDGYPGFTDCDDADPQVHPFAKESCDGIDNDCDGTVDEGDATDAVVYYPDLDQDGYGDPRFPTPACAQAAGYTTDATDCDDLLREVNPDGQEVCDLADNDCDGYTDDEDVDLDESTLETFHADADGDGYADETRSVWACSPPSGYVAVGAGDQWDCDDGAEQAHPGGTEVCGDGLDNDCDGTANDCGIQGEVDLASEAWAELWGDADSDQAGYTVASAGDADGDGMGDLLVGTPNASIGTGGRSGAAYFVAGPVTGGRGLTSAGRTLEGYSGTDGIGIGLAGGADGFDDVVVGAYGDDTWGSSAGLAFLVLGSGI